MIRWENFKMIPSNKQTNKQTNERANEQKANLN